MNLFHFGNADIANQQFVILSKNQVFLVSAQCTSSNQKILDQYYSVTVNLHIFVAFFIWV